MAYSNGSYIDFRFAEWHKCFDNVRAIYIKFLINVISGNTSDLKCFENLQSIYIGEFLIDVMSWDTSYLKCFEGLLYVTKLYFVIYLDYTIENVSVSKSAGPFSCWVVIRAGIKGYWIGGI